jgi:hypothetical protein
MMAIPNIKSKIFFVLIFIKIKIDKNNARKFWIKKIQFIKFRIFEKTKITFIPRNK